MRQSETATKIAGPASCCLQKEGLELCRRSVRESVAGRSGKEARAAKQREELRSSSMIEGGLGGARVPPRRSEATHWSEATTAERSDALERSDNKMPRPKAEV